MPAGHVSKRAKNALKNAKENLEWNNAKDYVLLV